MSETVTLITHQSPDFKVTIGERTVDLVNRFSNLNNEEKELLVGEAEKILSQCVNLINNLGSVTGIAVGYVQSGKTMSFTTLTALAIDNGFRIIIYLTGVKNNLLEQTTKRLKKDLLTESDNSRYFKVYQSPSIKENAHNDIKGALKLNRRPTVLITVLKHTKHINDLAEIFNDIEVRSALGNNGVLIIDDEADQASLNTYARKNSKSEDWEDDEISSTYSSILALKSTLNNHSYIQYTATPQANLLINIMDLLAPKFHVVLTPGKAYTGGKTFFKDNPDLILTIPDSEVYHHKKNQLRECPQSLIDAMQLFLMGTAIYVNINTSEKFLSMMIHADREKDASKQFYDWTSNILDNWSNILSLPDNDPSKIELLNDFNRNYPEAVRRIASPPNFESVIFEVSQILLDINLELVIQGGREIEWNNASAHVLIGADMLNRGFTIEGLSISYMPRYSVGKSNADTIQQRCRFFGYKSKYLDVCRVFLPNSSILEYGSYVEHEEIMRKMLVENPLEKIEQLLIISGDMNPTRSNVLSKNVVNYKLSGWRQLNALQNIKENTPLVQDFLSAHNFINGDDYGTTDRNHRYVKLNVDDAIEFLKNFKLMNVPDALRKSSTIHYLRYLSEKKLISHVYMIEMAFGVVRGRERALIKDGESLKIKNIFSGPSPSGENKYPGDRAIKFDDSLCIQIHKVKLRHPTPIWDQKVLYTLGIYYPEAFAHSFVGIGN